MYRKNVAGQYIYFVLVKAADGTALTGATVTAYRALDNGSQASATGTTTELANGQYRFNLSQADTNANYGSYLFTAATAVPVEKTVVFTGANPTDATAFGLSRLDAAITSRLAPTVAGRTLDVTSGGAAGIDWANVENQSANVGLGGTYIGTAGYVNEVISISLNFLLRNGLILAQGNVVASTSTTVDLEWQTREPSLDLVGALAILTYDDDGGRNSQTRIITNVASIVGGTRLTVDIPWSSNPDPNIPDEITIIPGKAVCERYYDPDQGDYRQFPGNLYTLFVDNNNGGVNVYSMEANTLTASALATDAVTEITNGVLAQLYDDVSTPNAIWVETFWNSMQDNVPSLTRLLTMMEQDGVVFRFTTNALEQAPGNAQQSTLLQVKAKTDLITSTTNFVTVERVAGATITMYFSEATTATVGLDEDTSSLTLRFVVENSDQLDVLVIENANITRTASNFTVTITTAVTATLGQYRWALRDITGGVNRLIEGGVLQVVGAANKDA